MVRHEHVGELSHLLQFCCTNAVIRDFEVRGEEVVIMTGLGQWSLQPDEARLFLIGALKFRPDLRNRWHDERKALENARSGIAA